MLLRYYQNILKSTPNEVIQSNFELKIDALICLDVGIVSQSKLTIMSSFSVNLVNFDTVLFDTQRHCQ